MKNKKLIIISAVLLIFILVDLFFVLPSQVSQLKQAYKKESEIREKLERFKKDLKNKGKYKKQKEKFEVKARTSQDKFVSENDSSFIIAEINKIAKDQGLKIISIQPKGLREKAERKGTKFYYLPFVVQLNAGFHDIGRFLAQIEKLDFSLVLKRLIMEGNFPQTKATVELCGVVKK